MRKADVPVQEVVCSETGKPMPKIPLWMADIKVKFISDEARQKHPSSTGVLDVEPERRSGSSDLDELKDLDTVEAVAEEDEPEFEEESNEEYE